MYKEKSIHVKSKIGLMIIAILPIFILFFSFLYAADGNPFEERVSDENPFTGAVSGSENIQYTQPDPVGLGVISSSVYWPNYNVQECRERQDFLLFIQPGACSPTVVRSDLLEEQDVPVFCKLSLIQLNPLIDVSKIRSIRFAGRYPEGVRSIGYYPARAAIRSERNLEGSAVIDNIGYLVVVLARNEVESTMPEWILANVTASVEYDTQDSLGMGKTKFYTSEISEEDWSENYADYGFWKGKAFLRTESITKDGAIVSIYSDETNKVARKDLEKGETSSEVYLPGYYCQAGMTVKLNDISYPKEKARIEVNGNVMWVVKGDKFLGDRCIVRDLRSYNYGGGYVDISCSGSGRAILSLTTAKAIIGELDKEGNPILNSEKTYEINDLVKEEPIKSVKWNYYLAYAGDNAEMIDPDEEVENFAVIVKTTDTPEVFADRDLDEKIYAMTHHVREGDWRQDISQKIRTAPGRLSMSSIFLGLSISSIVGLGGFWPGGVAPRVSTIAGFLASFLHLKRESSNIGLFGQYLKDRDIKNMNFRLNIIERVGIEYINMDNILAGTTLNPLEGIYPGGEVFIIGEKYTDTDEIDINWSKLWGVITTAETFQDMVEKVPVGNLRYIGLELSKDREYGIEGNLNYAIEYFYDKALENYENIHLDYPNEVDITGDPSGAVALNNAGRLSEAIEKPIKAKEYYERVVENYPDSKVAVEALNRINALSNFSVNDASANFVIDGDPNNIRVLNFRKPVQDDFSAYFLINGEEKKFAEGEIYFTGDILGDIAATPVWIRVNKIRDNYIEVEYNLIGLIRSNTVTTAIKRFTSETGMETLENGKVRMKLLKIDIKKEAEIEVVPKMFGPRTEANVTFKIGIEKRAIQLSPEKTQEMIENLNNTINDLNETSNSLGEVVKGLKGACFASSILLTAKNSLLQGSRSYVRNKIMTSPGGWTQVCTKLSADNSGLSLSECFYDNQSNIEADIDIYLEAINEIDNEFKRIQGEEGVVTTSFLGLFSTVVKSEETRLFRDAFKTWFSDSSAGNEEVILPGTTTPVELSRIIDTPDTDFEQLSEQEMSDLMLYVKILQKLRESSRGEENSRLDEIIKIELGKDASSIQDKLFQPQNEERMEDAVSGFVNAFPQLIISSSTRIKAIDMSVVSADMSAPGGGGVGIRKDTKVGFIHISNTEDISKIPDPEKIRDKDIILSFKQNGRNYNLDKAFVISKNVAGGSPLQTDVKVQMEKYFEFEKVSYFKEIDNLIYKNPYNNPIIRFHEFEPYKGLPALVPFDEENGWYVATDYVLTGFGKPYSESGMPINFWICNVGEDRIELYKQGGDDICTYVNLESGGKLDIAGLGDNEQERLVEKARRALMQAAESYGEDCIKISGFSKCIKVGEPAGFSGANCEDFMKPSDCGILYNLCDPVLCPSSRCNMNNKYNVANVVQSGIIGSALLCIHNFGIPPRGVMIPVCLSGLKAGLDGLISIFKSARDCLQESLTTGRNIGVCDEIKSIYLCEFVWRQMGPLTSTLVPNLIEIVTGGVTRGGGEYLNVRNYWDHMEASLDFFKSNYASESLRAFNLRNTEEAGGEICKMYVSSRYPNSIDFLNNLVEPDVPVQYHGWFEEISLTTATIPSTSQYKVYYHIYAGKDYGSSYVVSLKEPDESSFYNIPNTYVVDSGYVSVGTEVDEARDFTAVSGYKKLCISINNQEECGFGRVSTSATLDYLSDKYVEDQVIEDVKTSSECVAGSRTLASTGLSLINPNIESGVQDAVEPELYDKGVIRVCSTYNPGLSSATYDELQEEKTGGNKFTRWRDIGYCGDKKIRCWLDVNSVRDAVSNGNYEVLNKTLAYVNQVDDLNTYTSEMLTDTQVQEFMDKVDVTDKAVERKLQGHQEEGVDAIELIFKEEIESLTSVLLGAPTTADKFRALRALGELYNQITRVLHLKHLTIPRVPAAGGVAGGITSTTVPPARGEVLAAGGVGEEDGGLACPSLGIEFFPDGSGKEMMYVGANPMYLAKKEVGSKEALELYIPEFTDEGPILYDLASIDERENLREEVGRICSPDAENCGPTNYEELITNFDLLIDCYDYNPDTDSFFLKGEEIIDDEGITEVTNLAELQGDVLDQQAESVAYELMAQTVEDTETTHVQRINSKNLNSVRAYVIYKKSENKAGLTFSDLMTQLGIEEENRISVFSNLKEAYMDFNIQTSIVSPADGIPIPLSIISEGFLNQQDFQCSNITSGRSFWRAFGDFFSSNDEERCNAKKIKIFKGIENVHGLQRYLVLDAECVFEENKCVDFKDSKLAQRINDERSAISWRSHSYNTFSETFINTLKNCALSSKAQEGCVCPIAKPSRSISSIESVDYYINMSSNLIKVQVPQHDFSLSQQFSTDKDFLCYIDTNQELGSSEFKSSAISLTDPFKIKMTYLPYEGDESSEGASEIISYFTNNEDILVGLSDYVYFFDGKGCFLSQTAAASNRVDSWSYCT